MLACQSANVALSSSLPRPSSKAWVIFEDNVSRTAFVPRNIPKPYSALSSNKELAQAGPCPLWFLVYGIDGAEPPQIEEQPVALATIMRSPKSWVMSFTYGVSPQPAQAPENSKSGCSNWLPLRVVFFIGFFLGATFVASTA